MATAYQEYLISAAQHQDPVIRAAYQMVPQVFIDQAFGAPGVQAKAKNYLDASLVSASNYNSLASNTDFFRVELIDGKLSEADYPVFKFRLQGKIDLATKQMVPMLKGALPNPNQPWLPNFRSDFYTITPADVQAGKISESDYAEIYNYCKLWQSVGQPMYSDPKYKGVRLSFIARNEAFLFSFHIRFNPNMSPNRKPTDPLWTPAICDVAWSNAHLFKRESGQTANNIVISDQLQNVEPAPIVQGAQFEPTPVAAQQTQFGVGTLPQVGNVEPPRSPFPTV